MATVAEYVAAYLPALSSSTSYNVFVSDAALTLDSAKLGDQYNKAVALKACHDYTTKVIRRGNGGQVTMIQEARASMQFAAGRADATSLDTTSFGQDLKDILRIRVGSAGLVLSE